MEFFTYSEEKRPVRLSEATRQFAYDSLNRVYGKDTEQVPGATLDHIPNFEDMTPIEQYDCGIMEIARQACLRICPGEKLSGAATFGMAIHHMVPFIREGVSPIPSVSHLTLDFATVLRRGIDGVEADILARLTDPTLSPEQQAFLRSGQNVIAAMHLWHGRYLEALKDRPDYAANYQNLLRVPFAPATTFYEAVQSLWFTFAFVRLCGNWPGFGRLDVLLGDYLERDLAAGRVTPEEAREILAHFFIKGCEWVGGDAFGSGDAQHYQNIVLAGIDEQGREVTNAVTYLVLDILEEFNIGDFPTSVRLNAHTPEKLLRRVAQVMKHGGGVLAVYNEEVVITAMTKAGYPLEEARGFANDGCWEMQVPGKTNFSYSPVDALGLLRDVLHLDGTPTHFDSMEELKTAYFAEMGRHLEAIFTCGLHESGFTADGEPVPWPHPSTVVSLLEDGCIRNAAGYVSCGTTYFVRSPHLGGAADAGNSLRVIDKLCFIDKILPFDRFMAILQNNWEGEEVLRQYVLNRISCYGNDDDEADRYTVELVDTFAALVTRHKPKKGSFFVPGVSTFGRQIEWRHNRPASPHGHRQGEVLAPNMGATPGSDLQGATALIRSYCKIDLTRHTTGAALDLKLLPSAVRGEDGTAALIGLMRGFVALGGCFLQPDVLDNRVLRKAQEHPEQYGSLSVRVSGWNARFVTLDREWQDMCIAKTEHGEL